MSKTSRYEWRDQQAALQERVKGFLLNPGNEQLEAVVAEMRDGYEFLRSNFGSCAARFSSYRP